MLPFKQFFFFVAIILLHHICFKWFETIFKVVRKKKKLSLGFLKKKFVAYF